MFSRVTELVLEQKEQATARVIFEPSCEELSRLRRVNNICDWWNKDCGIPVFDAVSPLCQEEANAYTIGVQILHINQVSLYFRMRKALKYFKTIVKPVLYAYACYAVVFYVCL